MVVFMGWLFASSCSPPRLSATQLLSATEGQLPSSRDFHPTVGVRSWAHEHTRPACSVRRLASQSQHTEENSRLALHQHLGLYRSYLKMCEIGERRSSSLGPTKWLLRRPLFTQQYSVAIATGS